MWFSRTRIIRRQGLHLALKGTTSQRTVRLYFLSIPSQKSSIKIVVLMKIYYILYPFLTPKFLTWTLVVTLVTVDRHLLRWPWVTRVVHVVLINVGFWVEGLVSWVICGSKVLASGLKMLVSGADSCLGRDEGLPGMTPRVTREWCGGV